MATKTDQIEGQKPDPSPSGSARYWAVQIEQAENAHREFVKTGDSIIARYRNDKMAMDKAKRSNRRLPILYSNTETLRASLYARTAKPDVRQRHTDKKDIPARIGGEMIEKALSYCADNTAHDTALEAAVLDLCLPGRGVVWMDYEPTIQEGMIVDQKVHEVYVHWKDFLHAPARHWSQVWWIARRHLMTLDDLEANGFDDAAKIPRSWVPDMGDKKTEREAPDEIKRAEVWEIWSKPTRQRFWYVKGYPKVLRVDDDPYNLADFFPCPEPLAAVQASDSVIPGAYFTEYEDLADDLDELQGRISILTKALRRRGVYDASVPELKRLAKANDNEFIPSPNFAGFATKGGLAGAFQVEDISVASAVLAQLYEAQGQLIQRIYEVSGISDVLRGSTDPSETATAQSIKAQYGSMRMKRSQRSIQRWVRELYRIKAELMCEHFEPQILMQMSGVDLEPQAAIDARKAQEAQQAMMQRQMQASGPPQMPGGPMAPQPPMGPPAEPMEPAEPDETDDVSIEQVMAILRNDKLRGYRVDIETDSTVFEDAETERQARTEVITAIGSFMSNMLPVAQAAPELVPLIFEMMAFGTRSFKAGRALEDAIDEAREAVTAKAKNPPPPQPDPQVEKAKIDIEGTKVKAQADMMAAKTDMAKSQMDMQFASQKHALDMDTLQTKAALAQAGPNGMPQ